METPNGSGQAKGDAGDRLVYVVAPESPLAPVQQEIDLLRLWTILWESRWLIVGITSVFALGAALYASVQPPLYTASVVLAPVKEAPLSALASQLGGLANLAGLTRVASGNTDAVAVLKSRDFIRAFIEEQQLLPILYPDLWDEAAGRWKVQDPPSAVSGAGYFVGEVRTIEEDPTNGLVTLSVEWGDPELAASWANALATRLNDHMRQRALTEAEANVKYLRREFESTSIVALQQSISGLLENEMQKLMLARGNSEYAFRIIDRAEVPSGKSKPRTTLIVLLATFFGGMVAVFVVFILDMVKRHTRSSMTASE